ncbi:MAG: carboxypeptidase-like regulatory domain-containing protein, partial [Bacteroidota bacterium]
MKSTLAFLFSWSMLLCAVAQTPTQSIRGTVFDRDTRQPLIGAEVFVVDQSPAIGTTTDVDGNFLLENVPVGRIKIEARYIGYEAWQSDGINLNSAKSLSLNIPLTESAIVTEEVVVRAFKPGSQPLNDAAMLSARSFSVEETQRYAASANDPGRMAMGLPGVQPSRDTRSDITIRGNSTIGLLWRLEGIDIPNPNHFARRGTSGGGITIFSISMLSNSDFSVGAFPAEYGNALSGVFDMKLRKGNMDEREYTFRAGLLGLDFSTEGPIKKGRSSYLVNYRYSTLGILNNLGFNLVGERIDNTFQDLSFNLAFTSKNNKSYFNVWGLGGLSLEQGGPVEPMEDWRTYSDYTIYDFETNMGAVGVSYKTEEQTSLIQSSLNIE